MTGYRRVWRFISIFVLVLLPTLVVANAPFKAVMSVEPIDRQAMESIFRSIPTGIGLLKDCRILKVNDYVLDLTGYTREERNRPINLTL